MSDVLRDLAAQGLGVAWLAESSVDQASGLVPLASRDWDVEVAMLAYKQKACTRPAVNRLWQRMQPAARPPRLKQTRVGLTLRRLRGNPPAARNTANPSRRG